MPKKKLSPHGARIFGIGFAAFACLFIAVGVWQAGSQGAKLTGWQPVEATIISSAVDLRRGKKGAKNYAPAVTFTYRVDGQQHTADKPLPLDTAGSHGWAYGITLRYKPGQSTTAYYNPRDPSQAFLFRQADSSPYLFILFPMIHVCIGLSVWWFAGGGLDARGKARRMGTMAVLWDAVGILALIHFAVVGGAFDLVAGLTFGIYLALGGVLVLLWVRFLRQAAAAGPAAELQSSAPAKAVPHEPENPFRRPD